MAHKKGFKKGYHAGFRLILLMSCISLMSTPLSAKKLNLSSDHFRYTQNKNEIIASSNVHLVIDDITVTADVVHVNTETKQAWGNGQIQLTRGDKTAHTRSFHFDLDQNIVTLGKTRVAVKPSDKEDPVYLTADEIIDYPTVKVGKNGQITTCDLATPHYHVSSGSFDYTPDERIIGYNVHLHFPLLGFSLPIPLLTWWWTPIYNFELGKRRIIWNFPTIGRKETTGWGWFVQNRIDYDYLNGKESSVLVDWFENKGIGVGLEHQYEAFGDYGELKLYHLEEEDTGDTNQSFGLTQGFRLSDEWFIKTGYEKVDAEKINASVTEDRERTNLGFTYDNLGDIYDTQIVDNQNHKQNYRNTSVDFVHKFNKDTPYSVRFKQRENKSLNKRNQDTTITHHHDFSDTQTLDTNLYYGAIESLDGSTKTDQKVTLKTVYKQPITDKLKVTLTMDHFIDPDGDRVTTDETGALNNFFFKEPELKLDYDDPDLFGFNFQQDIIIARYQEMQFDRSRGTFNIFPAEEDYDLLPNTYRFTTDAKRSWTNLWNQGTLSVSSHYDQYIFKTPGANLFEGDAFYKLNFTIDYSQKVTSFLNSRTAFDQTYIDEEGFIPYLTTIASDRTNRRSLQQDFTFFVISPSKYAWTHKLIYDFENEKWNQYSTQLKFNPDKTLNMTLSTSLDLNKLNTYLNHKDSLEFETQGIFQPLIFNWSYKPTSSVGFTGSYARNINEGLIRNSNFAINFGLGNDPDYNWQIQTLFDYDTSTDLRNFDINNYEMQTYSIIKQEHCRRYKISYNKRREEFRFEVVILAFPKDPITIEKSRNIWRIKGFLDKGIKERF